MHAHARRMAAPKCSVGVPVSQYDMAVVLLAFSVIPLDIMVADCNVCGQARPYRCILHRAAHRVDRGVV